MIPADNSHLVDAGAVGIGIATFFGWLPNIAALLTVVWMLIRVAETELGQIVIEKLTGFRWIEKERKDDE